MHHRKTYMYINFQQNQVSESVKTEHTNLFAKKNHAFRTCTTPLTDNIEINRPIGIKLPQKEIIDTDGQTDREQTDGQTSRTTTIGSFFRKKEKNTKNRL